MNEKGRKMWKTAALVLLVITIFCIYRQLDLNVSLDHQSQAMENLEKKSILQRNIIAAMLNGKSKQEVTDILKPFVVGDKVFKWEGDKQLILDGLVFSFEEGQLKSVGSIK